MKTLFVTDLDGTLFTAQAAAGVVGSNHDDGVARHLQQAAALA